MFSCEIKEESGFGTKFRLIFTVEADEEMKEKEARGLSEDEKTDRPSEVMSALDKGLSAFTSVMSEEVDT